MSEREELEKRLDQHRGKRLRMTDRGWQPVNEQREHRLGPLQYIFVGCALAIVSIFVPDSVRAKRAEVRAKRRAKL